MIETIKAHLGKKQDVLDVTEEYVKARSALEAELLNPDIDRQMLASINKLVTIGLVFSREFLAEVVPRALIEQQLPHFLINSNTNKLSVEDRKSFTDLVARTVSAQQVSYYFALIKKTLDDYPELSPAIKEQIASGTVIRKVPNIVEHIKKYNVPIEVIGPQLKDCTLIADICSLYPFEAQYIEKYPGYIYYAHKVDRTAVENYLSKTSKLNMAQQLFEKNVYTDLLSEHYHHLLDARVVFEKRGYAYDIPYAQYLFEHSLSFKNFQDLNPREGRDFWIAGVCERLLQSFNLGDLRHMTRSEVLTLPNRLEKLSAVNKQQLNTYVEKCSLDLQINTPTVKNTYKL